VADETWPIERFGATSVGEGIDELVDQAVAAGIPKLVPKSPPSLLVKLIIGKRLFETATMNCRVSNAKLKRRLGWVPRYPSFREGLRATVDAIGRGEVTP
jgi:nucleoside-diphosphate-sugar epimerase